MRRLGEFGRKTRIIICDDNYDHASGIRELINLEGEYDVIANAANVNIAIALIKKYQPDIVLMDINMPDVDGITGINEIEKLGLNTKDPKIRDELRNFHNNIRKHHYNYGWEKLIEALKDWFGIL